MALGRQDGKNEHNVNKNRCGSKEVKVPGERIWYFILDYTYANAPKSP